jgi:prepilin-type N-terminal cleavage/methylation domain-containing protein
MKNKFQVSGFRLQVLRNRPAAAFTIVELLVVITIIGILAAFIMPIAGSVKRTAYINKTQAEMAQLETAIENYKAACNFYPPSDSNSPRYPLVNQLYYELIGTTLRNGAYSTLDGNSQITTNDVASEFYVNGFVNCSKGSGEEASSAKSFLSSLSPKQIGYVTNSAGIQFYLILGSAGGPDPSYQPLGASGLNPWRYLSPGVNNPGSYDLWIQLVIKGQTNLICNWSKQVQINQPQP